MDTEIKYIIPKNIHKKAKAYMKDVVRKLVESKMLETIDSSALDILADSYSTHLEASEKLKEEGITIINKQGNVVIHPLVKIKNDAGITAFKIMQDFGLTARSRKKMSHPSEESREDENSPLESFLRNHSGN